MTATLIQLLIQRRITTLSNLYLAKRDQLPNTDDVEAGATKKHQMDTRTWLMPLPLLIGLLASVVGYIGCFSVVQNSTSTLGPISWLCLEAGFSVMRLVIWARGTTRLHHLRLFSNWTNTNITPFPLATKTTRKSYDPSHSSARFPEDYHVVRWPH